jgi:Tetratricopeptide repeat
VHPAAADHRRPYNQRAGVNTTRAIAPAQPGDGGWARRARQDDRGVNNLGLMLRALGDLSGARAAYQRALRIFEAHLGGAHPSTQTVQRNLEALALGRPDAT